MNHSAMVDLIHALEPSIAEELGTDLDDAREFALQCLYMIEGNAKLFMASKQSLAASILTAAHMRLVPSLGLGKFAAQWLDGSVQALFSPSWRGWLQILHDHAGVVDATAEAVFSRDRFFVKRLPDARDALEFEPCTVGPRGDLLGVFVRLVIETKSGGRLTHVETVWRSGDLDPVTPDGSEGPGFTRNHHDYVEFAKTVALKRAAKWCAARSRKGSVIIAAAIELERGSERSNVVPSAERVARMLGIDFHVEAAPVTASQRAAGDGGTGTVLASAPHVAKDSTAAPALCTPAAPPLREPGELIPCEEVFGVCCWCRNGMKVRRAPGVKLERPCPHDSIDGAGDCVFLGKDHSLCGPCFKSAIKRANKPTRKPKGPGAVGEAMGVKPGSHALAPDEDNESPSPEGKGEESTRSEPGNGAPGDNLNPVPLAGAPEPNTKPSDASSKGAAAAATSRIESAQSGAAVSSRSLDDSSGAAGAGEVRTPAPAADPDVNKLVESGEWAHK